MIRSYPLWCLLCRRFCLSNVPDKSSKTCLAGTSWQNKRVYYYDRYGFFKRLEKSFHYYFTFVISHMHCFHARDTLCFNLSQKLLCNRKSLKSEYVCMYVKNIITISTIDSSSCVMLHRVILEHVTTGLISNVILLQVICHPIPTML